MIMNLMACSSHKSIVGTWSYSLNGYDNIIIFNSDATMTMEVKNVLTLSGTYSITDTSIDAVFAGQPIHYEYKLDGDTLQLTTGEQTETFYRQ